MTHNDLRFLLKEKYHYSETQFASFNAHEPSIPLQLKKDIELLKAGHPLAYVIGNIEFLDLTIDLSQKPLIPRAETEYWVKKFIDTTTFSNNIKLLDIFCGSGCIGLALYKYLKSKNLHFDITLSDMDAKCIKQSKINAQLNFHSDNIKNLYFIQSNLFENLQNQKFDFILANPPYVSRTDSVGYSTKYEPQHALYPENFDTAEIFLLKFLYQAKNYLNKNGILWMETSGAMQIKKILIDDKLKSLYKQIKIQKDQFGIDRVLVFEI